MTAAQNRVRQAIQRVGESFLVGPTGHFGVFSVLSVNQAALYIGLSEAQMAPPPIRALFVPYDDAIVVDTNLVWNSLTFKVRKAIDLRYRAQTLARMLVITLTSGSVPAPE